MDMTLDTPPRQRTRKDARLGILLPTDLKHRVEREAVERDVSISALTRHALLRELAGAV